MLDIVLAVAVIYLIGRYFYLQPDVSRGEIARDFSAVRIDGQPMQLAQLRGHYVLLDFWGSWCGPCRRQNPRLVRLYEQFKTARFTDADGFEIVSVALERDEASWRRAIEQDALHWPYHLLDRGAFGGEIAGLYDVRQIPSSFLIDPQGRIIGVNLSPGRIARRLKGKLADE